MTRPAQHAKKLIKLKFMLRAFEIQSNSCGYLLTPGLILTLHRPNGFLWVSVSASYHQKHKQNAK